MESNNGIPTVTGWPYLLSYSGGLNILEEILNITVIVLMALSGSSWKANLLIGASIVATIHTAILIILHIRGVIRRSKLPWHWVECITVFVIALTLVVLSTVVMAVFTRGYIFTGILGYLAAMVYFADTLQKYQIAVTPVPKYAWTTPNMPDLNY